MTDQPSSQTQPSMEDILASIRRIIDDEESKPGMGDAATVQTAAPHPEPAQVWPPTDQHATSVAVDDDMAAQALAEYDAALGASETALAEPDPDEETIFPERGGALWRRVAGHPLSDGEADPLPADISAFEDDDDTFELTETLDGDDDDVRELDALLNSAATSDPVEDARVLDDVAALTPQPEGDGGAKADDTDDADASIGIGAMTAAGVSAAGAFSSGAMDRIAERMSASTSRAAEEDDDGKVLDLTRRMDDEAAVADLAETLSDAPETEDEMPTPIFERVDVAEPEVTLNELVESEDGFGTEEVDLDDSFEQVAVTGLSDDYAGSFSESGTTHEDDAHERALDERFYSTDGESDEVPEIGGDYASSLGGDPLPTDRDAAAHAKAGGDELDTVGGLVRDALRSRLPAPPAGAPDNTPLVTDGVEDSAARSLASLARYDPQSTRRIYGGIKITDDEDSPTIEGVVQDTLRPMLRDWLNDNLSTVVESMVKQEVERISARSRRFVRDEDE